MSDGGGAAVFIFGCGVEGGAFEGGNFNSYGAVWCGDGHVCAIEDGAGFGAGADAEGGELAEEEGGESC